MQTHSYVRPSIPAGSIYLTVTVKAFIPHCVGQHCSRFSASR